VELSQGADFAGFGEMHNLVKKVSEDECSRCKQVSDAFSASQAAKKYELEGNLELAAGRLNFSLQTLRGVVINSARCTVDCATLQEQILHIEEQHRRVTEAHQAQNKQESEEISDRKFAQILEEFQASEKRYNEDLRIMEYYQRAFSESLDRLGPPIISLAEFDTLFLNLGSVIAHSDNLLKDFDGGNRGTNTPSLCGSEEKQQTQHILASMQELGRYYKQYLGGDVHDVIHKLENENAPFRALVEQVKADKRVQTLSWYTIMPVQVRQSNRHSSLIPLNVPIDLCVCVCELTCTKSIFSPLRKLPYHL